MQIGPQSSDPGLRTPDSSLGPTASWTVRASLSPKCFPLQLRQSKPEISGTDLSLTLQFENPFQGEPFLPRFRVRERLLKSPHEIFPLLNLGIALIGFGLGLERKVLVDFHDHEHSRSAKIDFHVLDAGLFNTLRNLRPDFLMMALVFFDQLGIVLQVQRHAEPSMHWSVLEFRYRESAMRST